MPAGLVKKPRQHYSVTYVFCLVSNQKSPDKDGALVLSEDLLSDNHLIYVHMTSVTTQEKPKLFLPGLLVLLSSKLALHLIAILNGYGLHRDEYLYLAEGQHPMLGYMEGPPVIGWVAGASQLVFGGSVWAAKVPVLLVGMISLYLIVQLVREFGGGNMAQLVAGAGWLLSPVYLGSNNLFQPVSFNQFCWLIIALGFVRVVKYQRPKDWYILGAVVGLALLTKYSVVFYLLAIGGGMLLTPQRKLLANRHCWIAAGIALAMWLPNIWWQLSHNFPLATHMQELSETQLVNVSVGDFLVPQFLFHGLGILIWLPGLWYLLRSEKVKPYRTLGYAFVLLIVLLLVLSGKSYYTYGAYSVLFAAGGCFWGEKLAGRSWLLLPPLLANFILIPYGLPIFSVPTMQEYGVYMRDNAGFSSPLRWEDDSVRDLSQDYSDMHGWEEMVKTVADFYHKLSTEEQAKTMIYAGNYGQAGALALYGKKYNLPEPSSFNASFLLWTESDVVFDRQIAIEDSPQGRSEHFDQMELIDDTHWPYAREVNYIYYLTEPSHDVQKAWKEILQGEKKQRLGQE